MDSSIYTILKRKSIVEYLERKGYRPVKQMSNGRLSYLCPFPDHKETKPSFVVWTNADYENFHCFGCQRHHHIIHLVSQLEGISYKEAVRRLGEGLEISLAEDIDLVLKRIDEQRLQESPMSKTYGTLISISSLCRVYLNGLEVSPAQLGEEEALVDRFYGEVDRDLAELNFESIEESLENLPVVLALRKAKVEQIAENLNTVRLQQKFDPLLS